jgi:hypothetical protein
MAAALWNFTGENADWFRVRAFEDLI